MPFVKGMKIFMKEARHIRKKVLSDIESGNISLEEGVKRIQQLGFHSAGLTDRRYIIRRSGSGQISAFM